jgi:hypothetical protein
MKTITLRYNNQRILQSQPSDCIYNPSLNFGIDKVYSYKQP